MLKTQEWTENKPYLIAVVAPQAAIAARDIHEAFHQIKDRRILAHQFPLPHLPSWFALYRSHIKPNTFIQKLFTDFSRFKPE